MVLSSIQEEDSFSICFIKENNSHSMHEILTKREKVILEHLADGKTYKAIAEELNISTETVRKHLSNMYKKLGVHNKIQAILKYRQLSRKQ